MGKQEISEYLAEIGRKGGEKKVPKGFATMDPEQAREIRSAGAKKMWANRKAAKKASAKKAKKATPKKASK